MKSQKIIGVEISPVCNLKCPNCGMGERLHIPSRERRDDPDLVRRLVEYTPLNSHLVFIGLGETTIPQSQKRIVEILSQRKDLTGFAQTNGTYPLSPESVNMIDLRRLEFGLSTDVHHLNGGQKNLRIQEEYVFSIATSVNEGDRVVNYKDRFPRLNRILVTPLTDIDGIRIIPSWDFVEGMCMEYQQVLGEEVSVYSELPVVYRGENNREYFRQAETTLVPTKRKEWMKSRKHGFYVNVEPIDSEDNMRFLIDGTYITDIENALKSWRDVDRHSKPIESLPKVFDLETGRYV